MIPVLFFVLVSCEKTVDSRTPDIPANDSIDVDNDLVYDFLIRYTSIATTDIPPSHQSITGAIKPLNDNEVLRRESVGHLFLVSGDTIRNDNNTNADWSEYAANVIGINGSKDKWDDEWKIVSNLTSDYIIGVKLIKDENIKIGWILLDLNKKNGSIKLIEYELSTQPELVIKRD